jgi:hypothetical protein
MRRLARLGMKEGLLKVMVGVYGQRCHKSLLVITLGTYISMRGHL